MRADALTGATPQNRKEQCFKELFMLRKRVGQGIFWEVDDRSVYVLSNQNAMPNNNKASRNWKYVLGMGTSLEAKPMGPILPLFFLPTCLGSPCPTFSEAKQPGTSNWPLRRL